MTAGAGAGHRQSEPYSFPGSRLPHARHVPEAPRDTAPTSPASSAGSRSHSHYTPVTPPTPPTPTTERQGLRPPSTPRMRPSSARVSSSDDGRTSSSLPSLATGEKAHADCMYSETHRPTDSHRRLLASLYQCHALSPHVAHSRWLLFFICH